MTGRITSELTRKAHERNSFQFFKYHETSWNVSFEEAVPKRLGVGRLLLFVLTTKFRAEFIYSSHLLTPVMPLSSVTANVLFESLVVFNRPQLI